MFLGESERGHVMFMSQMLPAPCQVSEEWTAGEIITLRAAYSDSTEASVHLLFMCRFDTSVAFTPCVPVSHAGGLKLSLERDMFDAEISETSHRFSAIICFTTTVAAPSTSCDATTFASSTIIHTTTITAITSTIIITTISIIPYSTHHHLHTTTTTMTYCYDCCYDDYGDHYANGDRL